jgi:eukaryotic-like serine/threonine-protein kinase
MKQGELVSGQMIASYRIAHKIGEGGMGAVYEAEHEFTKRRVALKVMHAFRADADYKTRMVQEVRALAQLDHPNVVRLIDGNVTPEGEVWMAMEFLEGVTLRILMSRYQDPEAASLSGMPIGEALGFLIEACDGVAAGHEIHIVHRDLKPENIFIAKQRHREKRCAKVLDFGAAKAPRLGVRSSTETILASGGERRVIGTPAYMSPEHLQGQSVDERTDIYALGIIAYEMLYRHPFKNADGTDPHAWELMRRQIDMMPPPLHTVAPHVPASVSLSIQRAIEKDAARRWSRVSDFASALRAALSQPLAAPAPALPVAAEPARAPLPSGPGDTDPMPQAPTAAAQASVDERPSYTAGGTAVVLIAAPAVAPPPAKIGTLPHAIPRAHLRSQPWLVLGVLAASGLVIAAVALGLAGRSPTPGREAQGEEAPQAAAAPASESAPAPQATPSTAAGNELAPDVAPSTVPSQGAVAAPPEAAPSREDPASRAAAPGAGTLRAPAVPQPPRSAAPPKAGLPAGKPTGQPTVNLIFGPKR